VEVSCSSKLSNVANRSKKRESLKNLGIKSSWQINFIFRLCVAPKLQVSVLHSKWVIIDPLCILGDI
jgi:hypothetical protein